MRVVLAMHQTDASGGSSNTLCIRSRIPKLEGRSVLLELSTYSRPKRTCLLQYHSSQEENASPMYGSSNLRWISLHCKASRQSIKMKKPCSLWASRTYDRVVELAVDGSPSMNADGCWVLYYVGCSAYTAVKHCRIWPPADTGVNT
jgi:hypothetical protein